MYRADLIVINPLTGESRVKVFAFDPTTMTPAKWANAYARFQAMFQDLITAAATSEPEKIP